MYFTDSMENWYGRVDSHTEYEAFRWHQIVEPVDLEKAVYFTGRKAFVFIGFCSEQGVERNKGRIGAAAAPDFIRRQMANMPCTFSEEVKMYDAGNILCDDISLEEGQRRLSEAVKKALELNMFPVVLGGGHGTAFGHYMGIRNYYKESADHRDIGIINFDAHFDIRPYDNGNTSGTMFRQIADICHREGDAFNYMPIGRQQHSNTVSLFNKAKELGVDYILARDIQTGTYLDIIEQVDSFVFDRQSLYITICADVFSSAFAPGVSATQSLGLDPEVVLPILRHILRTRKTAGFDICEVAPRFDQDNTTANLAAVIIFTVVNTICESMDLSL